MTRTSSRQAPFLKIPKAWRLCWCRATRLACLHAGLIASAQTRVYLTSPYFGPGAMVERALQAAARRGVDVRLLVPRSSDPPVAGWATRAAYAPLLAAGVRVYEYLPRQLHAKTSAIDGAWSIVGSANLDYRSLFMNQELVLIAHDRTLNEQLQAQYLSDLAEAAKVALPAWRRRGWRARPRSDRLDGATAAVGSLASRRPPYDLSTTPTQY